MSERILVVEDQKDDRQIICDVLAGTDYESQRPRTASRRYVLSKARRRFFAAMS